MDLNAPRIIQEEMKHAGERVTPVFNDLSTDAAEQKPTEIESMCMSCHQMGTTRLLLIQVPFFKELIVGSFECSHCGLKDSEITSAGKIQEKGVKLVLQVSSIADLNRQIVKSDRSTIKIPYVDLEISSKKGGFTTIEGTVNTVCEDLIRAQELNAPQDQEYAAKIKEFISQLKKLLLVHEPFQFIVEDPTGNSHIENLKAPSVDPLLHVLYFARTKQQDEDLGLTHSSDTVGPDQAHLSETPMAGEPGVEPIDISDEVLQFPSNCTLCNAPCETNMKTVNIPRFKQVIIMAMVCDNCGYRDNEVKSGSGIAEKGHKLTLHIKDSIDLSRDILKSDTASCTIPELDFHLAHGSLGGRFTTVEGLISNMRDQLKDTAFTFTGGDSAEPSHHQKMTELCVKLDDIISAKMLDVHIVLDDPAGNSYLQDIYEPEVDPCLSVEVYERTEEQNDDLGLFGMNTSSTDAPLS
ncbi:zinc finger protein ZPR1-like [Watersipora subatra]|uniref:zinc finger protein ZPR1-like n=1 Tax=Watersipora subatra TaxID=2589382 RepID=UPI00355C5A23